MLETTNFHLSRELAVVYEDLDDTEEVKMELMQVNSNLHKVWYYLKEFQLKI